MLDDVSHLPDSKVEGFVRAINYTNIWYNIQSNSIPRNALECYKLHEGELSIIETYSGRRIEGKETEIVSSTDISNCCDFGKLEEAIGDAIVHRENRLFEDILDKSFINSKRGYFFIRKEIELFLSYPKLICCEIVSIVMENEK